MGPPGGATTQRQQTVGGGGKRKKRKRRRGGSGLHEVMASRCFFRIIAGKNPIPAVVIYHDCQLTALKGQPIDRQET